MNNKLYCTFTTNENVEEITERVKSSYVVLFDKIFVLESLDGQKVMLTDNVHTTLAQIYFKPKKSTP